MALRQTTTSLPFQPLVIIGAGRSGTNALRDALVRLSDFATWPCDEINPIWRHGNIDHPDDAFTAEMATPAVTASIRRAFLRIWRETGKPGVIVEKTCANSLRVPFVAAVLPEARFIHIIRDGVDILASARKRWKGEMEVPSLPYLLAKARYAPVTDLPRYAIRTLRNRLAIGLGRREHFDRWGPAFAGMEMHAADDLDEMIARQWAACVQSADAAFATLSADRVYHLRYEAFAFDPAGALASITDWLGTPRDAAALQAAAAKVTPASVGKGQAASGLSPRVVAILEGPMRAHGYWA
jgi:hypothetical protein